MNSLSTFVVSFFIPGIGQLILKDYTKGIIILILLFLSPYLIITTDLFDFIPIWSPYIILMIWSIFDIFDKIEKIEGRKSASRKLALSVLITLIIIPATLFLLFSGLFKGAKFLTNEYLNEDRTKKEMNEISVNLEKHRNHYGFYPANYHLFISQKPIWSSWKADSWNNPYNYELKDSLNYQLISAGKDGIFNNEDDLKRTN
ncbi:hypothetical protein V8G69_16250 [Gaetbulibacter sp. M235]|uniref:hypothetical protein n=1 Tax=Gaetbulibacter sp. M235 TaxID=3126510 RepID=UPI00374FC330